MRWYGHVKKGKEGHVLRAVEGKVKSPAGRLMKTWRRHVEEIMRRMNYGEESIQSSILGDSKPIQQHKKNNDMKQEVGHCQC